MRTGLLAVAGWVVAAVLTVAVSWSAVSVVRAAVVPAEVVATRLPVPAESVPPTAAGTAPGTTPPGPARTPTARPTGAAPVSASAGGQGGTVTVRCVAGAPRFVNVTPAQGFRPRVDDGSPEVEFESATHRTGITASCAGGTPRLAVEEKGGRGGNSGPGGGDN